MSCTDVHGLIAYLPYDRGNDASAVPETVVFLAGDIAATIPGYVSNLGFKALI